MPDRGCWAGSPRAAPAPAPATAAPPGRLAGGRRARERRGGRCSAPGASPSRGCTHLTKSPRSLSALRGALSAGRSAPRSSERRKKTAGRRRYTQPQWANCAGSRRGSAGLRLRGERGREPGAAWPEREKAGRGRGGARGGAGVGLAWGRRGAGGADALPRPLAPGGTLRRCRGACPRCLRGRLPWEQSTRLAGPCLPGLDRRP